MKQFYKISFIKTILFLFVTTSFCLAQNGIPRDTSYTSKSALSKVQKSFPNAKLVIPTKELNIQSILGLEYTKVNDRKLVLDLFSPINNSKEKLPLVILIHGGGWVSGDRSMLIPLALQLVGDGFVSAAVEYRLAPEEKYPAAVSDILTAIKWLKYNTHKYNIDTNKVALLGTSAGGHLAAYIGTNWNDNTYSTPDFLNSVSAKVNAIVDIDGVLDLTHPAESGKDTNAAKPSVLKRWFGYTYKENPELWKKVSPVNHISIKTPTTLFVNSSIPRFHAGRDEMIAQMNKYDIYSEVHTIKDSPHSFWLFKPWFEPTKSIVTNFLRKVFHQKK